MGIDAGVTGPQRVGGEFGLADKSAFIDRTASESGVSPARLGGAKLGGQRNEGGLVFGQKEDAAGGRIEAVRVHQITQPKVPRPTGPAGNARVEQLHQTGPFRFGVVRRNEQAGGLIERQEMGVLIKDGDFPKFSGRGSGKLDG